MKRFGLSIGIVLLSVAVLTGQITQPTGGAEYAAADFLRLRVYSNAQSDIIGTLVSGSPIVKDVLTGNGELASGMSITGTGVPGGTTLIGVSAYRSQLNFPKAQLTITTAPASTTLTIAGAYAPIVCPRLKANMLITTCASGTAQAANKGCDADANADIGIPANTFIQTGCTGTGPYTLVMSAACSGGECTETDTGPAFTPILRMSANASSSLVGNPMVVKPATALNVTVRGDVLNAPGAFSPTAITPITMSSVNTNSTASTPADGGSLGAVAGKLISLVVSVSQGVVPKDSTWAQVDLMRGANVQRILRYGKLTAEKPLAWPSTEPNEPLHDTCRLRYYGPPAPSAGDIYDIPVPAGKSWEWISGILLFAAASPAGDRNISFTITSREGVQGYGTPLRSSPIMGGETAGYVVAQAGVNFTGYDFSLAGASATTGVYMSSVPKIKVMGGQEAGFHFTQTNYNVTDTFTELQLFVEECIVGTEAS